MRRSLTSVALILALGLSAGRAMALGFGKVSAAPVLGQPLIFMIALRLDPSETIDSACVKAEVSFGDRMIPDSLVRARVETSPTTGERRIRVTTTIPVDEPVVNIELHSGCSASLSRSFLVFADPPGRSAAAPGTEPEEAWVSDRAVSPTSSALSSLPPKAAASSPADRSVKTPARTSRTVLANSASPSRGATAASAGAAAAPVTPPVSRSRKPNAVPKPSRGPVLRLDPVEVDALISPSLQMATSLSQSPVPAASGAMPRFMDPEQEQRFRDQERLKAMEATLLKLRSDSQATEKVLSDMQVRVRAAEAGRYANPLVYLLLALCALLAAGLAAMAWLRRRDRLAAVWWTPPVEAGSPPPPAPARADEPTPTTVPGIEIAAGPVAPRPKPKGAPMSLPPPLAPPSRSGELESGGSVVEVELRRPMSAEELIDLEQQAEFFVVLGQDDAAIDLLMGHVRSTGGVSPLPYLKLLEIYRRRNEREPYDRMRERFNRRFNAYAPEWDVDPELGLSLEGYPEVMNRLQKSWASPSQSMDLLDAALFRRDAGPTFDVPAYRELLFLYGLSRDLAERDTPAEGVDLLLPLGDDDSAATTFTSMPPSPSVSSAPAAPPAEDAFTLDLDVSTDQPPLLSLDFTEDPDFKRSAR